MDGSGINISFEAIQTALVAHFWHGLAAFFVILLWHQRTEIIVALKSFLDSRNAALDKRTDELAKINERYFNLYENSSKALEKVSEAIVSFKEALISVEGRLGEKIVNKIDEEMESVRAEIRNDRLEKLTTVVRQKSNPAICDGKHLGGKDANDYLPRSTPL